MNFAFLVSRDGHRVIRWRAVALFCVIAAIVSCASAAAVSLVLVGDLRFAWIGVLTGLFIAVASVCRGLTLPVDQLPLDA